jgi:hypothetical protein
MGRPARRSGRDRLIRDGRHDRRLRHLHPGLPGADDVMLNPRFMTRSISATPSARNGCPALDDWLFRGGLAGVDSRLVGDADLLPEFASGLSA